MRAFRRIAPIGASISNRLSYPESVILSRNDDFIPRPSGKDKTDVKANCFDVQVRFPWVGLGVGECPPERQRSIWEGHPATRAVSMSSTNLEQISAAERTDGLPWVDLGMGRVGIPIHVQNQ